MAGERDVRLNVIIDQDARGAEKAARDLDNIDRSAGKADQSLRRLGQGTRRVDGEIQKHLASIKTLAQEYEKTGNADLFKNIRKNRSAIANLEKIKKELGNMQDAGKQAGETWFAGLQGALKTPVVGPALGVALAVGIIAAAPAIGAALNSAVLLGVGGGALAGGIALAVKDPKVNAAFGQLGATAMEGLTKASSAFTGPLLKSADIFGSAFARVLPAIQHSFASLSTVVEPLARGLAGFATNAMPGLSKALEASKPILLLLAHELPNLGNAVSDFFGSIADGAPGAIVFFQMLLDVSEDMIVAFGNAIEFLAKGFFKVSGWFADMPAGVRALFGPLAEYMAEAHDKTGGLVAGLEDLKGGFGGASDKARTMSNSLNDAVLEAGSLKAAFDALNGTVIGWASAEINAEAAVDRLAESLTKNGRTLDVNTEKGRTNKEALIAGIEKARDAAQAKLDETHSLEQANAVYDLYKGKLIQTMIQSGMTKLAAWALVEQLGQMPPLVATQVSAPGLVEANNTATGYKRVLDGLNGRVVTSYAYFNNITRSYGQTIPGAYARGNRYGGVHYADQGLVNLSGMAGIFPARSQPTFGFAEQGTGGEAFIAKNAPDSRSLAIADTAASWHGGMVVPRGGPSGGGRTVVELTSRDPLIRTLLSMMAAEVRGTFGGDVQVALGGAR